MDKGLNYCPLDSVKQLDLKQIETDKNYTEGIMHTTPKKKVVKPENSYRFVKNKFHSAFTTNPKVEHYMNRLGGKN